MEEGGMGGIRWKEGRKMEGRKEGRRQQKFLKSLICCLCFREQTGLLIFGGFFGNNQPCLP